MAKRKASEQEIESDDQCVKPFISRQAFPGDRACVTRAERLRILRENIHATSMLQNAAFFNGVDTVGP